MEAIHSIAPPTTRKWLRRSIGIINYYHDMWKQPSDLLGPLTALCSPAVPWQWTDVEQEAFDLVRLLSKYTFEIKILTSFLMCFLGNRS